MRLEESGSGGLVEHAADVKTTALKEGFAAREPECHTHSVEAPMLGLPRGPLESIFKLQNVCTSLESIFTFRVYLSCVSGDCTNKPSFVNDYVFVCKVCSSWLCVCCFCFGI